MKKFVLSVLCAVVSLSAYGQGTILLSNIGGAPVTVGGAAAGNTVQVSFATADSALVGKTANVLGAGFFSAGESTLEGLTGTVDLRLAGSADSGATWSFSDTFSVTLGNPGGVPPTPAANAASSIPGLDISAGGPVIPEPSTIALAVLGGAALMFRRRK